MKDMKKIVLLIGALVVIGGLALVWTKLKTRQTDGTIQGGGSEQTANIPEGEDGVPKLIIGGVKAPITIIEYGDFQCPICKRFFEQTEPQLISEYIDTGKAKIEFRVETHIGKESQYAGEAAYCGAEQDKFQAMHDVLYRNQGDPDSGAFSYGNLKRLAAQAGLDQLAFDTCLDSGRYRQTVIDSNTEAQRRISGTPTFFIGDQKISGAQPIGVFRAVLDAQ